MGVLPGRGLDLLGQVARLLNDTRAPAQGLLDIATAIQRDFGARSVTIWHRAPNSPEFQGCRAPDRGETLRAPSLESLPRGPASGCRVPLLRGMDRLGMLDVEVETWPEDGREVLRVVADMLAPYLDALELSEDLASEVALRAREAEAQRRFISLVIDSLPIGLYVVDRDYRIQAWNRMRESGTQGLMRQDVVGRSVFEVLTRQPQDLMRAEFNQVFRTGESLQAEIEVPGKDPPTWYRISKIPMRLGDEDRVTHVITIGEDITATRATQRRVHQSEKLAAIGQLAAGIMHEINNPLATISACASALEGRLHASPDAAVPEYLDIIEREVQRCSRIVDGLLDFARPGPTTAPAPMAVNGLLQQTLFLLKHHEKYKQVTVRTELAEGLPLVVADGEQMIQVFMALMINAFDAMEQGGMLTVRTRRGPRETEVMVEVADTGVGISPPDLERIFEPFYTTKPPGRGTGLGLSICYGIVERHRGHMTVESEPGRGTIFRVVLPAAGSAT